MIGGLLGKLLPRKKVEQLVVALVLKAGHGDLVVFFRHLLEKRMTPSGRDQLRHDLEKVAFQLSIGNTAQAAELAAKAVERFKP